jgi:hypothetical protein
VEAQAVQGHLSLKAYLNNNNNKEEEEAYLKERVW